MNISESEYQVMHAGLCRLACARFEEAKQAEMVGDSERCRSAVFEYEQALHVMRSLDARFVKSVVNA